MKNEFTMTTNTYLLFAGCLISGNATFAGGVILEQALANHLVSYSTASHLNKNELNQLCLAKDSKDKRRVQLKALSQYASGTDATLRGANCGFHSLRNGVQTALGIINKSGSRDELRELSSEDHMNRLFGTKLAPWRVEIGKIRNELTARRVTREIIFKSLSPIKEGIDKEYNLILQSVGSFMLPMFSRPEVWEDGYHYRASKKDIYDALVERCHKAAAQNALSRKDERKRVITSSKLDKYFTQELEIHFTIDFEGNCYAYDSDLLLATVPGERYGSWVQSDEMSPLVDAQRGDGILSAEPMLFVATYGEELGGIAQHAVASEKFMELYSVMRETKDDCVGVVLVYLPGGNGITYEPVRRMVSWVESWFSSYVGFAQDAKSVQSRQDSGHWVTLVVARIKGDVRYYILDSLGANRLRTSHINDVIDMFDRKKALPGYEWSAKQAQQIAKPIGQPVVKAKPSQLSWTTLGVGVALAGLCTYGAYSLYTHKKKKQNP
jgi:hypothetical protein